MTRNRKTLLAIACFSFLIFTTNAISQNSFTNPVLYSLSGASNSYSNNEGGTTTFSGAVNQKLLSVEHGSTLFKKVPVPPPVYRIERNTVSAQYTGATFYAEGSRISQGYNLLTSRHSGATGDDIMINIFSESIINSGEDNIFNNITSSATYNNIERVDFIFPDGNQISDPGNQGFIISERGGNDNFKIVIVQSIDGSNRPTSYFSTVVSISPSSTSWSMVRSNVQTYPFRVDPQNPTYANPVGTTPSLSPQNVMGIFFKFSDFGITAGTTVYGISIGAGDSPSTASDWLNISNFPTNTNETMGGLDFTGVTGMYNQTATLSGTVFHDANGATGGINGTGINSIDGIDLFVYLIDINDKVYEKQQPAANGTYSFVVPVGTVFNVMISTADLQLESSPPSSSFGSNSQWVNTGEQYGNNNPSGSGIDPITDGIVEVSVNYSGSAITNVNFGIQKKPQMDDVSRTDNNPGGTLTVQAPSLSGIDEDGTLGTGTSFKILSLPNNGTLKYNGSNVSINQVISNYQASLLVIDPHFDGPGVCEFTYTYTDAAGFDGDPGTATLNINGPIISGSVFNDANGGTPDGTGIGSVSSQQLYAYLADASNNVYDKTPVGGDGTFSFSSVNQNMNFTLVISTENVNIGNSVPASAKLPEAWHVMQDNYGVNNGAGTGSDGNPDLRILIQIGLNSVTSVNFGLNREPESNDNSGSWAYNTTSLTVPNLSGSDPEDGALGAGSSFRIKSLPHTGTLGYNGSPVSINQLITNYNASLLTYTRSSAAGGASFNYAAVDAAGTEDSTPAEITMLFTRIDVSGTVYHDANGTVDNTVNGTASGNAAGVQLFAYLVNTSGIILDRVNVDNDGSWTFSTADQNTNYTVRISSSLLQIGATGPSSANLPSGWVPAGESYGNGQNGLSGLEAGTPDMQIEVRIGSHNNDKHVHVTNVRFGYQQRPQTNDVYRAGQNPGSGISVAVPAISGSDAEDGVKGSGSYLRIVSRPANASLYYDNVLISTDNYNITNYNPALLEISPAYSVPGTSSFTVSFRDNAHYFDSLPANVVMSFSDNIISGNIYHDANGLTDSQISGTGINSVNGNPLYAYLVNTSGNILEKTTVNPDGSYALINASASTTYEVRISTSNLNVGQSGPASANLPGIWTAVGDSYGTNNGAGSGFDATPDLKIDVITPASGGVSNINFGIQQAPSSNDVSSSYNHPGANNRVQVPELSGSDPEDGNKGAGHSFKITSLPSNANLYYNNSLVSLNQVISAYDPVLFEAQPIFGGNGTISFTYSAVDNANVADPTPNNIVINLISIAVSGNVYNDANGTIGGISGTGLTSINGNTLYAYLANAGNTVIQKVSLGAQGQFSFSDVPVSSNYSVQISDINVSVGQNVPATFSASPVDWVAVGEDYGLNNGAGSGIDAQADGKLSVIVGVSSVTEIKIGFNRRPDTYDLYSDHSNPGGTATVQVPTLSGSDPEDGALGASKTFRIKTLPANGNLYYNNSPVVANQLISNYNPSLLKVDPTFNGYGIISFTYASVDEGGYEDLSPATIEMTIVAIYVRGRVVRDANGITDNLINGPGLSSVAGNQLYAYLVLPNGNINERASIQTDGNFTFYRTDFNSNYQIRISTLIANGGDPAPASHNLPPSWSAVGDSYGVNNAAGIGIKTGKPNIKVDATSTINDIELVYFGAQPRPVAHEKVYTGLNPQDFLTASGNVGFPYVIPLNSPAGTTDGNLSASTSPGRLSGFDDDDGKYAGATGTSTGLKVAFTRLPDYSNAVLRYNTGAKSEILLVPSPTPSDASYPYWNDDDNQYEIENFNPNNLELLYERNDQEYMDFEYAWFDEADEQSDSELYHVEFEEELSPLPIALISFTASYRGNNEVVLNWVTVTETNSDYFSIEKSIDARTFVSFGKESAAGNSNRITEYSYTDFNAEGNIIYYRLKAVDFDGSSEYSNIIRVSKEIQNVEFLVYPNPATHNIKIMWAEYSEKISIKVYSADGSLVIRRNSISGYETDLGIENLSPGYYTIQLLMDDAVHIQRFVKN